MIAIVGDLHHRFKEFFKYLESTMGQIDCCLQVGDLGNERDPYPDFPVLTYFIQGNHENWDAIEEIKKGKGPKNLQYLENGKVHDIQGLKVLALGGNYAPSKYRLQRKALSEDSRRHFVKDEVEACCTYLSGVDIFFTHEAPSPYHRYKVFQADRDIGIPEVSRILNTVKPKIHFFGHHHNYRVYEAVPGIKSVGLAYGSSEILLFDRNTFQFYTVTL